MTILRRLHTESSISIIEIKHGFTTTGSSQKFVVLYRGDAAEQVDFVVVNKPAPEFAQMAVGSIPTLKKWQHGFEIVAKSTDTDANV